MVALLNQRSGMRLNAVWIRAGDQFAAQSFGRLHDFADAVVHLADELAGALALMPLHGHPENLLERPGPQPGEQRIADARGEEEVQGEVEAEVSRVEKDEGRDEDPLRHGGVLNADPQGPNQGVAAGHQQRLPQDHAGDEAHVFPAEWAQEIVKLSKHDAGS